MPLNRVLLVGGCTLIGLNSIRGSINDPISRAFQTQFPSFLAKISFSCFMLSLTVVQGVAFDSDQAIFYSAFDVFLYYCACLPIIVFGG